MGTEANRGTSVDTAHYIVALLIAKPRTAPELGRLTEACRQTVWRHLKSLVNHQLVTKQGRTYSWHTYE